MDQVVLVWIKTDFCNLWKPKKEIVTFSHYSEFFACNSEENEKELQDVNWGKKVRIVRSQLQDINLQF